MAKQIDSKVPQIRFKGFEGEWVKNILDVISDVRDGTHESPKYHTNGHPLITSKNVKDGWINYENVQYICPDDFDTINKRSKVDENDILMGMIGTIGNTALIRAKPDFAIKNVALIKRSSRIDEHYLYQYFQTNLFKHQLDEGSEGGTQKFISLGKIRALLVPRPSPAEQTKIGGYFKELDGMIALHQRKHGKLVTLKQAMLQKMFPQNGATTPEIRFKGFSEPWVEKKLYELSIKVTQKNVDRVYSETFTNSAEFGIITQLDYFDKDISNSDNINGYYVVEPESFVYNPRISSLAPCGPVNRNKLNRTGVMSPLYTVFKTKNVDNTYLEYFFKTELWHAFMFFNGDTGARADRFSIKDAVFIELPVPYPHLEEQQKIGIYFRQLDTLISKHATQLEKLKQIKSACLEKMFV